MMMNRAEYLAELKRRLKRLPEWEAASAIRYYEEYFDDAGVENELKVITELGAPSRIAANIIGEYAINGPSKQTQGGLGSLWIALLAVFASPVALPVSIALVAVVFAVLVSLFAVYISFVATGIALIVAGVFALIGLPVAFLSNWAGGVFYLGVASLVFGMGCAILVGVVWIMKWTVRGMGKLVGKVLVKGASR